MNLKDMRMINGKSLLENLGAVIEQDCVFITFSNNELLYVCKTMQDAKDLLIEYLKIHSQENSFNFIKQNENEVRFVENKAGGCEYSIIKFNIEKP